MDQLQTQLLDTTRKTYKESQIPIDLTQYNDNQVKSFDVEMGLTPILPEKITPDSTKKSSNFRFPAVSIDEVYFEPEFTSADFQTSLRLLAETLRLCEIAISEFNANNLVASDDSVSHIQNLLPELFCCRALSDSFGAIINSIQNALFNNRGMPLDESKLRALSVILAAARNEPFMRFDKAIELIMVFEDNDFIVEPFGFDLLTELLDD